MSKRRSATDRLSIYLSDRFDNMRTQDRVQTYINSFTSFVLKSCGVLVGVCVAWAALPHIETQLLGVAHSWRATNIVQLANGNWQMDVFAVKPWYRANCEYIPGQRVNALVMGPNSVAYEGVITYLDDNTPDSTRPAMVNEQYFGRWELDSTPPAPAGSQVMGRVKHDCDMPWITVTNVGPFYLPTEPTVK